jgi:long-chain acyl-CoA synthetase
VSRVRVRSVENSADLVADTLPRLLRRNAAIMAHRPAIREKTLGIWRTFSWAEYERQVRDFALGLAAHGFRRGDKLAVIGDNRPRLYWAQLAAQCLGGIAVPIYQDAIATEMAFVLNHAEIRVVVAEDQEQVDKILSLKAQLPTLDLIVYGDPSGMRHSPRSKTCRPPDVSSLRHTRAISRA